MENKMKTSGTCQACFGSFALRAGCLVLHGFKRPGCGYTIGECWGVNEKPYELDCEVTKKWHEQVQSLIAFRIAARAVQAASDTVTFIRKDYRSNIETFEFSKSVPVPGQNFRIAVTFSGALQVRLSEMDREIADLQRLARELDERITDWIYAPEKLVKEERKGPTVHAEFPGRPGRKHCSPMRIGHALISHNPAEVTCSRCLARRK